jgi:hypothetical protein
MKSYFVALSPWVRLCLLVKKTVNMTALKLPCPALSHYPIPITWQSTSKTWSHSTRWNPPTHLRRWLTMLSCPLNWLRCLLVTASCRIRTQPFSLHAGRQNDTYKCGITTKRMAVITESKEWPASSVQARGWSAASNRYINKRVELSAYVGHLLSS